MAQMVARNIGSVEVTGSIPVASLIVKTGLNLDINRFKPVFFIRELSHGEQKEKRQFL